MKRIAVLIVALLGFTFYSCENEPIGTAQIDLSNLIEVNSELYGMLQGIAGDPSQNTIACIDFQYAFTLYVFDEELEIIDAQIIHNDLEFSEFLGSIPADQLISLSYPITSVLANGDTFEITNNQELKEAIDLCLRDELLGYCNGLLEECIWRVTGVSGGNTAFEGTYFDVSDVGAVGFYYEDNVFDGTWVTFFIEEELHLNIHLLDDSDVGQFWNFDWMVEIIDENQMELTQGGTTVVIEKQCASGCEQFAFEQCEIPAGSGSAAFPLTDYIECFLPFVDGNPTDVTVSFHLTQADALNNENPLDSPYTNVENPQVIYVRVEDNGTGLIYHLSIILRAVPCE